MLFKTNKKFIFMYRENVKKTLTKTFLQFTEFSSSVSVKQVVNVSWETFNVIITRQLFAQSQQ